MWGEKKKGELTKNTKHVAWNESDSETKEQEKTATEKEKVTNATRIKWDDRERQKIKNQGMSKVK